MATPTPTPAPTATAAALAPADAAPRVGHAAAGPPALPASAARLDLELKRGRGGELSRTPSSGGALAVLPRPPELSKLARELELNRRADCRKAYADGGLSAAAPLAADALRGDGCKW